MANAPRLDFGDVVLVPFPFTDQSGAEKNPSGVRTSLVGLVKTSVLKPVVATIEQGLVVRFMGRLSTADIKTLREVVADVIG